MRRIGLRFLMGIVGLSVLVFYLSAAALGFIVVRMVWLDRPETATTMVIVGLLVVVAGYASYRFGTARMLSGLQAAELPRQYAPGLYRLLDRLCTDMELDPPSIVVAALPAPNAFALGAVGGDGVVVFDRTLLGMLDAEEVEAILAHELAHLESRDALVQTLAVSAANTIVGVLYLAILPILLVLTGFDRGLAWIRGRPWDWGRTPFGRAGTHIERTLGLVLVVFTVVILAYSRRREFAADDRAASVTGNPGALAKALHTIDRASRPGQGLLSILYTHESDDSGLTQLFSTHPSMQDRIHRLRERARSEMERNRMVGPPRR